ncbi:MAG: hypothetical protein OEW16_13840 [Gammaproteobacteria bacterium]|nr:hypothetical protein [Gammaproteobacteria bacterium]
MAEFLIVPFRRELAPAFQRLNLDWIERLFVVEEADRRVLGDPWHMSTWSCQSVDLGVN